VGPGDPELITLKAVRVISECGIIALPRKNPRSSVAYQIAVQAVPEIREKTLIGLDFPMVSDISVVEKAHRSSARIIAELLDAGENVACLTLGDPSIYCTFGYIQRLLEADGYDVEMISGVPSFCAAAAAAGVPLCERKEPVYINSDINEYNGFGNYILMKSAGKINELRQKLMESGKNVYAVENCGMKNQSIYFGAENLPDDAGYFTLIIAKQKQ
jgi:precorrin-2/cobalt-factor-2 C20-methyltransferase